MQRRAGRQSDGLWALLAARSSHQETVEQIFQYHLRHSKAAGPRRQGPPAYCSCPGAMICPSLLRHFSCSELRGTGRVKTWCAGCAAVLRQCPLRRDTRLDGSAARCKVLLPSSQRKNIGRQVASGAGFWTARAAELQARTADGRGVRPQRNSKTGSTGPRQAVRPESEARFIRAELP